MLNTTRPCMVVIMEEVVIIQVTMEEVVIMEEEVVIMEEEVIIQATMEEVTIMEEGLAELVAMVVEAVVNKTHLPINYEVMLQLQQQVKS